MAAHTSLLLVIALCTATARSLRCFSCDSVRFPMRCRTVRSCASDQPYCKIKAQVETLAGVSALAYTTKCIDVCTPGRGNGIIIGCCSTDLCNVCVASASTGSSIRSSYAAIILALGSLLAILRSSVL